VQRANRVSPYSTGSPRNQAHRQNRC